MRHTFLRGRWIVVSVAITAGALAGLPCGGGGSPDSTVPTTSAAADTESSAAGAAVPGTITASVSSVTGESGSTLSVGVYDFDWSPGAPNTFLGLVYVPIDSDDFSTTTPIMAVGADGSPTQEPAEIQPGTYSVVFFVGPAGSAPKYFSEVRVT